MKQTRIADLECVLAGGDDANSPAMPSYDKMLTDLDKDKDGALSKAEAEQAFGGFFDNQDANKDGKVSREEYEAILQFINAGKSAGFALKPGGSGDITESHILWNKTKGLPYVSSAIVYQGQFVMMRDGGIVSAFDAADDAPGASAVTARVPSSTSPPSSTSSLDR